MDSKYFSPPVHTQSRKVDDIFKLFENDKDNILRALRDDPKKLVGHSLFPQDKTCLYRMGTHAEPFHKSYACACCRNLRRLVDFRRETLNQPFLIESGKYEDSRVVLTESKYNPYLELRDHVALDQETNAILNSWVLEGALPVLASYQCGEYIYTLRQSAHEIDFENPAKLLVDLFGILYKGLDHNFVHGNPTVDSLRLVDGELRLTNLENSSIQVGNKRIYHPNLGLEALYPSSRFSIKNKSTLPWTKEKKLRITVYLVEAKVSDVFIALRHFGNLMLKSFDGYSFFISLMLVPEFRKKILEDSRLVKVWEGMWLPSELKKVNIRLCEETSNDLYSIIKLLDGIHLRDDVIEYVHNALKDN